MNIILCGLPMSGKTTIGQLLAEKLGWNFIDTDRCIESAYGENISCREIFREEGEEAFRRMEREAILSLKGTTRTVIALGGGALTNPENISFLRPIGTIAYLKAPHTILWNRMCARGIPAYLDAKDPEQAFYALAKRRIPDYEQAAAVVIDTDILTEKDIIEKLRKAFNKL